VRAAISIWQVGEAFRDTPMGDLPPLGNTRVGLHRGVALVGNIGGEARTSYSALGGVMTTAARLESANRELQTKLLVSREALPDIMIEGFRVMGRIRLPAQSTPVEVFEAAPDFPVEARQGLNQAYARFDAGDAAALEDIRALGAAFQEDLALANLIRRLETVGPGGAFQLE
jgi:adenylate cyclase